MLKPRLIHLGDHVHRNAVTQVIVFNETPLHVAFHHTALGSLTLFRPKQIVITTQPKAELVAHLAKIVEEGEGDVDESMLTGESLPADKHPGSPVYAGTVNGYGALRMLALRGRRDSALSDIITMVGEAAAAKAPIARLADRISGIFVPLVVLAAFLTALVWIVCGSTLSFALGCAIAVLVISCPCALVISVPLSFFGGIGGAAKQGILIKGGNFLELLSKADSAVFDKTGTLTKGVFAVNRINVVGCNENELLEWAAYCENVSSHPVAKALRNAYGQDIDVSRITEASELSGYGVSAVIDGKTVLAGNSKLMEKNGIEYICEKSGTVVYVAVDNVFKGSIIKQNGRRDFYVQRKAFGKYGWGLQQHCDIQKNRIYRRQSFFGRV